MAEARVPGGPEPAARVAAVGRAWALVAFFLLSVFPYFGRLNNPNENARIWAVKAIVDFHELSLDRVCAQWGYVNDKAIFGGKLYSSKAPGASFIGVPIYFVQARLAAWSGHAPVSPRAMTWALRFFGVSLPMVGFLALFSRWVARLTRHAGARDLLTVGLGLGTMMAPYGVLFVGHAWAAALAFASFVLLTPTSCGDGARPRARWALAGALAGFAVMFEYQVIFAAVLLTTYAVFRDRRGLAWFLLGALVPAVLLGAYHTALFGRPWDFPLGHLENPAWAKLHNDARAFGLHPPEPKVAAAVLFAPWLGLFAFSPFLLGGLALAVVSLMRERARGERAVSALTLAIFVAMVCFLAGVPNWRSGWCVGPRYIVVVVPFLASALAHAWPTVSRKPWLLGAVTGAVAVSVILNAVSAAIYPHYPEAFDNPVFDLTWPLLRDGYVPYSLGTWLGLPGRWSLIPCGLSAAAALGLALHAALRRARPSGVALALGVAALLLGALSRYGRTPRAEEDRATTIVRQLWEPTPAPVAPAPTSPFVHPPAH